MKARHVSITTLLVASLMVAPLTSAQETPKASSHAHSHDTAATGNASSQNVSADAQAAVAVADQFNAALKAGDFKAVEALLDPEVLILESGGAERSRQEYLSHHAISDAAFLKDAHVQPLRQTAKRSGDLVWIGSESEIHAQKDGKPLTLLSTGTMVLKDVGGNWKIVHIHWSSRPKK